MPFAAAVAHLAAAQHGVVHREQLLALGLGAGTIDRWIAAGRLIRLHRGVYAVGHIALPELGPTVAAILACSRWDAGDLRLRGAAASHLTAAALLGIRDPGRGAVHVASQRRCAPRGVVVHRTRRLDDEDVDRVRGVPCTAWPRTLIDLAELLDHHWLVRALERSTIRRRFDHVALEEAMARHAGRRGIPRLRDALARGHHLDPQRCDSVLEELFLLVVRSSDPPIPEPRMQVTLRLSDGSRPRIDALYPVQRIAIELDSRWHDPAGPRMRDARRDAALRRDGYVTFRLRYADVTGRPAWVRRTLRRLLAGAAAMQGVR